MIPKIIHYTWFSGEEFPDKIKKCIDSWKLIMPDYEFRLWDMNSIKNIDSDFLKEAIECKKWAFAADYVRLFAIYNEGGIYLDTDVLVFKKFDEFLSNSAFIGKESSIHFVGRRSSQYLTSHCFGAEKHNPFIKRCLEYFEGRHFIVSTNNNLPVALCYNFVLLPYIQAEIARQYGYDWRPLTQNIQKCEEGLTIYPSHYFDGNSKNSSYCQHLALGGWREDKRLEPNYTLSYKIKWRLLYFFKWVLQRNNYISIELE